MSGEVRRVSLQLRPPSLHGRPTPCSSPAAASGWSLRHPDARREPEHPIDIVPCLSTDVDTYVLEKLDRNEFAGALSADPAGKRSQVSDLPRPGHVVARCFRPSELELPDPRSRSMSWPPKSRAKSQRVACSARTEPGFSLGASCCLETGDASLSGYGWWRCDGSTDCGSRWISDFFSALRS